MEWLKRIKDAASINESFVIVENSDPERRKQLVDLTFMKGTQNFFAKYYLFDLREGKIYERSPPKPWKESSMKYSPRTVIEDLKRLMESEKNFPYLVFVLLPERHEREISSQFMNFLLALQMNDKVRFSRSFMIVETSNASSYFTKEFLENFITIRPPLPDAEERRAAIIKWIDTIVTDYPQFHSLLDYIPSIIKETAGLNLRQTKLVSKEAITKMVKGEIKLSEIIHYISEARIKLLKEAYDIEITKPQIDLSYVGGYDYIKEPVLDTIRFISLLPNLQKYKIDPPKGILFFGPPGTGKTFLGHAIAGELGWPLVMLDFSKIGSKWFGESERRLKLLLDAIDKIGNVVVLFDEVEQLFMKRESAQIHEVSMRLVSILNTWLASKTRKAFVVATANFPELLDPATIRAGRFDDKFPVMYPNAEARKQIFEIHMFKLRNLPFEGDLEELVRMTHMFNGAEIETLVRMAVREAVKENGADLMLTVDHFRKAKQAFDINDMKRMKEVEIYLQKAREFGSDPRILSLIEEEFVAKEEEDLML